jgi:hypothetical protein
MQLLAPRYKCWEKFGLGPALRTFFILLAIIIVRYMFLKDPASLQSGASRDWRRGSANFRSPTHILKVH